MNVFAHYFFQENIKNKHFFGIGTVKNIYFYRSISESLIFSLELCGLNVLIWSVSHFLQGRSLVLFGLVVLILFAW